MHRPALECQVIVAVNFAGTTRPSPRSREPYMSFHTPDLWNFFFVIVLPTFPRTV